MGCSQTLAQQNSAMKAALVTLQKKLHSFDAQIAELQHHNEILVNKVKRADLAAEKHKEQAKACSLWCEELETEQRQQQDHLRKLEQENHELALDGDTQQQDLSKKAHEVSDLQQQRTSLTAAKEQLESQLAELKAHCGSWRTQQQQSMEQEQQLTAKLDAAKEQLANALSDAKQQQQRDQTYQDELVADKHQAMREAASLRTALAAAKQKEEGLQAQVCRLREDLAAASAESEALCARGKEQAQELSNSLLSAMAGIQESASRSQQHSFSSQADSLVQQYQTRLAQVSGDVSQVEAQLASLQQALLHGKDVLHNRLQDEMTARQQAEQTAEAMQTTNSRLRQMLTAMVAVKQTSKHQCHQPRPGKSPRAVLTSPGHLGRSTCCQKYCTAGHDRCLGRSQKRFISQVKTRDAAQDTYVKPRSSREAARLVARSREAVHAHLQRQQEARHGPPPPTWEPPLPAGSPLGSPRPPQAAPLPLQAWSYDSDDGYGTFESRMLSKGMQSVQESLQTEYDEMYEHYQVLAKQLACMQEAADTADEVSEDAGADMDTLHVALREIVDALDSKAAQLYALQHL